MDGAGTAIARVAADVGAGQPEDVAQEVDEQQARFDVRLDVGLNKRFQLKGRSSAEVALQVLNLLDNINFTAAANPGSGASIFQTTTIYQDQNNTYDPGGRLGQLMFRINW